jgi:Rap1a immunity proteins
MKTLCGISVVALVVLLTMAPCAKAAEASRSVDGNTLLRRCSAHLRYNDSGTISQNSLIDAVFCQGYALGMIEMHLSYRTLKTTIPLFCPPDGLQTLQAIRVVVRYLQAHPEHLHWSGGVLATLALGDAFPCTPAASRRQR